MRASAVDQIIDGGGADIVTRLAALPENQWFERKSGRIRPKDLAEDLIAFANAEGGTIVVGIHDGRSDPPLPTRTNDLRQAAHDLTVPTVRVHAEEVHVGEGATLLLLRVAPGEQVHETRSGECFLRVGDETKRLSFGQRQELEYDRGSAPYDGTPVAAKVDALDPEQVEAYRTAIGSPDTRRMLQARNLLTPLGELTIAGYLLFAEHPQSLFPNAHVRVLRYTERERGTGAGLTLDDAADIRCEGSLPSQIATAAEAIERLLPRRRALAVSGRFEAQPIVPRDAWLEGLVNAVLHRSYSMAGDHIRVEIFPDRMEIVSPGRFPGLVDPRNLLDIARHARNPRIARVCSDLGIAQELGEGIRRIYAEVRARGLTDPVYTQTQAGVRLVLSAADAIPADVLAALPRGATDTLAALRIAGRPLGTGQIEELAGITRPTALKHLRALQSAGIIIWEGQSQRDPRATWRIA